MKNNILKLELETTDENCRPYKITKILIGYVSTKKEVQPLLDHFAKLFESLIDANELTSCPILQNWESSHCVVGTWTKKEYGNVHKTEYYLHRPKNTFSIS